MSPALKHQLCLFSGAVSFFITNIIQTLIFCPNSQLHRRPAHNFDGLHLHLCGEDRKARDEHYAVLHCALSRSSCLLGNHKTLSS